VARGGRGLKDEGPCPVCGISSTELRAGRWAGPTLRARLRERGSTGDACPSCVQEAALETLLEKGEAAFHLSVQSAWPLGEGFGALPIPLRLHADPRFTGRGVTLAMVDAAFAPHRDLTEGGNRIRAHVDAREIPVRVRRFSREESPSWPEETSESAWHGLMTSVAAAGNGALSWGFYRGIASEADLVLVQVRGGEGRIGNARIARALHWLLVFGPDLGVRVVNVSLGGDPEARSTVDEAVAALVRRGVSVVVAAGNDGVRRLVPPATAPEALTIGGIDDQGHFREEDVALWHSNYGEAASGASKPELVAPSLELAGAILPGTEVAREAEQLFASRALGDGTGKARISEMGLLGPFYKRVEGTSFAAPLVAGVVAAMLEANPSLTPRRIRELLVAAAHKVPGAPPERQGAGALDAGRAVTLALRDRHSDAANFPLSPSIDGTHVQILLHDHDAREVRVLGSWDRWTLPGRLAEPLEPGLFALKLDDLKPGSYSYKFLIDGKRWLEDPGNPARSWDRYGGWNSVFTKPAV
jgi:serine protease AprX